MHPSHGQVLATRRELLEAQDTAWTPDSCYATCRDRLGAPPTFTFNIYFDPDANEHVCSCCRSGQALPYVAGAQLYAACAVSPGADSLVRFKSSISPRKLGAASGRVIKYRAQIKNAHASVALRDLTLTVELPGAGVTYRRSKMYNTNNGKTYTNGGWGGLAPAVVVNATATPPTVTWRGIVLPPGRKLRFLVKVRTDGTQWQQGRRALVLRGAVSQQLPANGLPYCSSGFGDQTVVKKAKKATVAAWGQKKTSSGAWGQPK